MRDKNDLLMEACEEHDLNDVKRLIRNGADVNTINNKGETPLTMAIYKGDIEIVKELIKNGADVNKSNNSGKTPFFKAVYNWREEIVKELIRNGADVNKSDNFGKTPLRWMLTTGNIPREDIELLVKNGADINKGDNKGKTPLIYATEGRMAQNIRALLEAGAQLNKKDNNGNTALDYAIANIDPSTIKAMIEGLMGKDVEIPQDELEMQKESKRLIGILIWDIFHTDYSYIEWNLKRYYKQLNINCDIKDFDKKLDYLLQKIENGTIFVKILKYEAKTVKKDLEEFVKKLNECENINEMGDIRKEGKSAYEIINDCKWKFESGEKQVKVLRRRIEKINKVMDYISDLETKLELDYKQLILGGIKMGEESKNKQVQLKCINEEHKAKGIEL